MCKVVIITKRLMMVKRTTREVGDGHGHGGREVLLLLLLAEALAVG